MKIEIVKTHYKRDTSFKIGSMVILHLKYINITIRHYDIECNDQVLPEANMVSSLIRDIGMLCRGNQI